MVERLHGLAQVSAMNSPVVSAVQSDLMTKKKQGATPKQKAKTVPRMNQTTPKTGRSAPSRDVSAPSSFGHITKSMRPRFSHRGDALVLDHCEFVGSVVTDPSNQFAYDVYTLDPANVVSFPWGSQIMALFETGELEEFEVIFKSITGTSTTGAVQIGIDYDANDDDSSVTERALMNWEDSVEANSWLSFSHKSKRSNLQKFSKQRFVNDDGENPRFFSFGNVFVATTTTNVVNSATPGPFTVATLGHLYFQYRMVLRTPQLSGVGSGAVGAKPTEAQMLYKYITSAAGIASTTNLLAGLDPASTPTLTPKEAQTDLSIELSDGNSLLQEGTTATVLAAGTPVFHFLKDFQGTMAFTMDTLNTLASTNAPAVTQYSRTLNAGSNTNSDRPDLSRNVFEVLSSIGSTASGTYGFLARVVASAGTFWRIAGPTYTALASANKYFGVNYGTRLGSYKGNGELISAKRELEDSIKNSRILRPTIPVKTGPIVVE